jgi:hypothetical protein
MTAYLDLNIFDRLEKLEKLETPDKLNYQILFNLLTVNKLITAYSNAHLK